jgi:hypothetical protein
MKACARLQANLTTHSAQWHYCFYGIPTVTAEGTSRFNCIKTIFTTIQNAECRLPTYPYCRAPSTPALPYRTVQRTVLYKYCTLYGHSTAVGRARALYRQAKTVLRNIIQYLVPYTL